MEQNEDHVRANHEETQRILQKSHFTWSSYVQALEIDGFSRECVHLCNILGPVPSYLADGLVGSSNIKLNRRHIKDKKLELFAGGTSLWRTSECPADTRTKTLQHNILVGVQRTTVCNFDAGNHLLKWPGVQNGEERAEEGNYLAVLAFAWSYVLSARWVDIQENESSLAHRENYGMQYSQLQAKWIYDCEINSDPMEVIKIDLGPVDDSAARWWAAILANGEGFKATIVRDGQTYQSPWSICLSSSKRFQLRRPEEHIPPQSTCSPPSWESALGYLSDFCSFHNICSQASVALSVCLCFPFLRDSIVVLPLPKAYASAPSLQGKADVVFREAKFLNYNMTISCNTWGMRALLCGVFFEPQIECNAVSPWLEPALEIIDSVVRKAQYVRLATIMGKRQPKLAALWLGIILTGGEKRIFRDIHLGLSAVELHAAAWTGTVHSFIGPLSPGPIPIENSAIRRSDEARLLFLTESEGFTRVPVCPWQPFGITSLESAEIEVRHHSLCDEHCLQYLGWRWDSIDETLIEDKGCAIAHNGIEVGGKAASSSSLINGEMVLRSELLSEMSTRSIFGWLRVNGFPIEERSIRSHEWFTMDETDEEEQEDMDANTSSDTSSEDVCLT